MEPPPPLAVIVATRVVNPVRIVAEKPALVAPAGTETEAGTFASPLLLVSVTVTPLEPAAAVRVTVQGSVPFPRYEEYLQETPFTAGEECAIGARQPDANRNRVIARGFEFGFLKEAARMEEMDGRAPSWYLDIVTRVTTHMLGWFGFIQVLLIVHLRETTLFPSRFSGSQKRENAGLARESLRLGYVSADWSGHSRDQASRREKIDVSRVSIRNAARFVSRCRSMRDASAG